MKSPIPLAIPSPAGDCFAMYHPASGPAVLICPPFGADALTTTRVWRELAVGLAARGFAVLRPDLPGTGDSAGVAEAPERIAAWRGAVAACHAWLAARHAGRITLFGYRFGAALALDAVVRGVPVDRLVLLDPPPSGEAYARMIKARARLEGAGRLPVGTGFIEAWGVPVSTETLTGLATLPGALPALAVPPTLLFLPDGEQEASPWSGRLATASAQLTVATLDRRYFDQEFPPPLLPPDGLLERVVAFLEGSARAHELRRLGPPPVPEVLAWDAGHDTPLWFGPSGRLFGVMCRPARPVAGTPAVLLPATGFQPRSGFGRMWTTLARQLAARGLTSLRFDMTGTGESDGRVGADPLADRYDPGRVADLRAALDALAAEGFGRAIAVGHCSGAYAALLAAAEDQRLIGVCAGNPMFLNRQTELCQAVLSRPAGLPETRFTPPAAPVDAAEPSSDGSAVVGRFVMRQVRRACPPMLREWLRGLGREERAGRAHLRQLLARGCAVHLVFAQGDDGHIRLRRAFGSALRMPPALRVTEIAGADHTFTAAAHRSQFLDIAAGFAFRLAGIAAKDAAISTLAPHTHTSLEIVT